MLKQLTLGDEFLLGLGAERGAYGSLAIGLVGIGFLIAEGAVLSARGIDHGSVALVAVLAASTVSSIAGFAFSALCGALLFHVMGGPVYVVQVMIVCSIAIQLLSVASLWRSIDWRSLPVLLAGGVPACPPAPICFCISRAALIGPPSADC